MKNSVFLIILALFIVAGLLGYAFAKDYRNWYLIWSGFCAFLFIIIAIFGNKGIQPPSQQ